MRWSTHALTVPPTAHRRDPPEQRETLYSLLQQATSDHTPNCPRAIDEC
jgi:hypothetical protein